MDKKRRIVVTGTGITSCLSNDVGEFYDSLLAGKSGVRSIDHFDTEQFTTRFAAYISDFDPGEYIERKLARRIDKCLSYALVAGKKALEQSGISTEHNLDGQRCGIIIGSGMGGMDIFYAGVDTLMNKGPKRMSPFFVPFILTNMSGGLLAKDFGFMGPNYSISTACATGTHSIVAAANHIFRGDADLMLAGGVEAAISPLGLSGFCACRALSQRNEAPEKSSRPWDKGRDGFVMGEGSGVIVLESLEHALARGANILAEYHGGGASCDAHHITEPRSDGEGVALCIRSALEQGGVSPEEVNYINAHATSTVAGDMSEINALKKVFTKPQDVVINGTKSMIGHCLGAAGGIEAVVLAKAIETGRVHPTINLEDPEEGLDFDAPTEERKLDINVGISNSFGFGGHNAVIAMGKYK